MVKQVRRYDICLVRRLGVLPDARAREVADVQREIFAHGG